MAHDDDKRELMKEGARIHEAWKRAERTGLQSDYDAFDRLVRETSKRTREEREAVLRPVIAKQLGVRVRADRRRRKEKQKSKPREARRTKTSANEGSAQSWQEAVGARIATERSKQVNPRTGMPLSQVDLAERLHVHKSFVSRLEAGQWSPTLRALWKVGKALGVQPASLIPPAEGWEP